MPVQHKAQCNFEVLLSVASWCDEFSQ